MSPLWIFLLSIYQFQNLIYSEMVDTPNFNQNALSENNNNDNDNDNDNDEFNSLIPPLIGDNFVSTYEDSNIIPFFKTGPDQTEVAFRYPISSVNIDYSKNSIILKFRKNYAKSRMHSIDSEEEAKRKSLNSNFMRFGRSQADFMRFGKRQAEEMPAVNSLDHERFDSKDSSGRFGRSQEGMRDSRGDNFMRFGRSSQDFMRFGRTPAADFMRFGRNPSDFMRLGRSADSFMRFGRNPSDFMRLGRGGPDDFMRFGRSPSDFMRLGRSPKQADFMRFGKSPKMRRVADKNFMRFGRPDNFMRFGRTPPETKNDMSNFMRFGKSDQNFMRFGKSLDQQDKENHTKTALQKNDIKETAKILRHTEKGIDEGDESNPMDKAIKVFYNKQHQQQEDEQQQNQQQQLSQKSSEDVETSTNDDLDTEMDYGFNTLN